MKLTKDNKSIKSELDHLKQEFSRRFSSNSNSSDIKDGDKDLRNSLRDISDILDKENNSDNMLGRRTIRNNPSKMDIDESPFSQPKISFGTTMPSASKSALKKKLNFKQKQIVNLEKINHGLE